MHRGGEVGGKKAAGTQEEALFAHPPVEDISV